MMGPQLTASYLLIMAVSSVVMAILVLMRARDLWGAGDREGAMVRLGFAIFIAACAGHFGYWFLRWLLLANGDALLSKWFVDHSSVLFINGVVATIGVGISCAAALWSEMRWRGVAISFVGVLLAWAGGLQL